MSKQFPTEKARDGKCEGPRFCGLLRISLLPLKIFLGRCLHGDSGTNAASSSEALYRNLSGEPGKEDDVGLIRDGH